MNSVGLMCEFSYCYCFSRWVYVIIFSLVLKRVILSFTWLTVFVITPSSTDRNMGTGFSIQVNGCFNNYKQNEIVLFSEIKCIVWYYNVNFKWFCLECSIGDNKNWVCLFENTFISSLFSNNFIDLNIFKKWSV